MTELKCCGCGKETINRVQQCNCATLAGYLPDRRGTQWMFERGTHSTLVALETTKRDVARALDAAADRIRTLERIVGTLVTNLRRDDRDVAQMLKWYDEEAAPHVAKETTHADRDYAEAEKIWKGER